MTNHIDEVVAKIRREIQEREDSLPAEARGGQVVELRRSASLAALNRLWPPDPCAEIRSHRRWIGPGIVLAKRLFRRLVLAVLEPYLRQERELLREMVRFSNETAERYDRLLGETEASGRRIETRLHALEAAIERRAATAAEEPNESE